MCLYLDWSICGACGWRTKSISSGSEQTPNLVPRCGSPTTKPAHGLPSWFSWRLFQRPAACRPSHFLQALNHGQSHRPCSRQHRAPAERSAPCSASSCTRGQDERSPYGHALQDAAKPALPDPQGQLPVSPWPPQPPPHLQHLNLLPPRGFGSSCSADPLGSAADSALAWLRHGYVPCAGQCPGCPMLCSTPAPLPGPPGSHRHPVPPAPARAGASSSSREPRDPRVAIQVTG